MLEQPTGPSPYLSVIIPARNCPDQLRQCLLSLKASILGNNEVEVIVVDDASTDTTAAVSSAQGIQCISMTACVGPALARNQGAVAARGEYLFFLDSDVCVHADTIDSVIKSFRESAELTALFGSYDTRPAHPGLISQYRNLYHHFVHQHGSEQASTFWSGCGAIKRSAFLQFGGFSPRYSRPSIEDIELGMRLRKAGHRIALKKAIQVTHLKKWTLWGMVRTDVRDRAIPWTRLLLRERSLPNDLNLKMSQRVSTVLAFLLAMTIALGGWIAPLWLALALSGMLAAGFMDGYSDKSWFVTLASAVVGLAGLASGGMVAYHAGLWSLIPLVLLALLVLLNIRLYAFYVRKRGWFFTVWVIPLQVFYFLYSGMSLIWGIAAHLCSTQEAQNTSIPALKPAEAAQ